MTVCMSCKRDVESFHTVDGDPICDYCIEKFVDVPKAVSENIAKRLAEEPESVQILYEAVEDEDIADY